MMIRTSSWLTVPTGLVLGLTMGAVSADAAGRSSCEARIFQGEELACFVDDDDRFLRFEKGSPDDGPIFDILAVEEESEQAEGFTLNGLDCGCQLQRRMDVICAGASSSNERARIVEPGATAVIASVNGSGKRIRGERFDSGEQEKFSASRVDVDQCFQK